MNTIHQTRLFVEWLEGLDAVKGYRKSRRHLENAQEGGITMKKDDFAFTKEDLEITRFNILDRLKTDADMALYLEACLLEGGPDAFFNGLGDVIRAKGITRIAKDTGLSREGLYKTFEPGRQPQFDTIWKIVRALGLTVSVGCGQTVPEPVQENKAPAVKKRRKREPKVEVVTV